MHNSQSYITGRPEGGLTTYRSLSVVATGQAVKATPGTLYGYFITNLGAATRYVKFYNKATAATVGTDTPLLTLAFPAGAAANVYFGPGVEFSAGISIGATTGVADADVAAPAANEVVANLFYK